MTMYEAFESRLNELLDARRDPLDDPEIVAAAQQSPECRQLLDAYRRMLAGLDALADAEPRREHLAQVIEAVQQMEIEPLAQTATSSWQRWPLVGAMTAALVTAAAVVLMVILTTPTQQAPVAVKSRPEGQGAVPGPAATAQTSGGKAAADAGHPGATTAEDGSPDSGTPEDVQLAINDLLVLATGISMVGNISPRVAGVRTDVQWVDRMSRGMKPVAESTTDFFDTVLDAFAVEEDERS